MLIYAVPVGVIIYSVKVGWKGGKGEVGTVEGVEVEQLRPLTVAMMGRNKVDVTKFYFYIHVLICIENMQQCCLTRFNKICHPSQRPRWQVDKEAIGLARVQQCSSTYSLPS